MADSEKAMKGAERYLDLLAEEGYRPRIDAYGDVGFKCEGKTYFIEIYDKDEVFFRLVYPNFWPIASKEELSRVKETALAVTAGNRVVKIFPLGGTNTWAEIVMFCSPPQTFTAVVFDRCLSALRNAVREFIARMQEPPEQDDFVFHLPKYTVGGN